MKFKEGDHVRILVDGVYHYGEITLIGSLGIKVLFDELNYWYYPEESLELILPKDISMDMDNTE